MGKDDERKIIGWKAIAEYLGVSAWAVKKAFLRAGIKLPKIAGRGRTSPVYLVKGQLLSAVLRAGFNAPNRRFGA